MKHVFALTLSMLIVPVYSHADDYSVQSDAKVAELRGKTQSPEEMLTLAVQLAEAGDGMAAQAAGEFYANGYGAPKDMAKACSLFEQSHKLGIAAGTHNYATCLMNRDNPDIKQVAILYKQASENGFTQATCALGQLYLTGYDDFPKDTPRGLFLCGQAADNGLLKAQESLGALYLHGTADTPRDCDKAKSYLEKAAAQNSLLGNTYLGMMYAHGNCVESDLVTAAEFLTYTANKNVPETMPEPARAVARARYELGMLRMGQALAVPNTLDIVHASYAMLWLSLYQKSPFASEPYLGKTAKTLELLRSILSKEDQEEVNKLLAQENQ